MAVKTLFTILCVYYFCFGAYNLLLGEYSTLELTMLNVGQGDALLITTPNRKLVLIDGGPNFEVDAHLPKICKLDVVVLTHPHFDHLAGLNRVLHRCVVGVVYFNAVQYDSNAFRQFVELTRGIGKELVAGDTFVVDGVTFSALWPTREALRTEPNVNNQSIVLFMDYNETEALFLGDAEIKSLSQLDMKGAKQALDGRLEFYKVSHHGSYNGVYAPLIHMVNPLVFGISVGANNSYGHPSADALALYSQVGTVYRTDLNDTIKLSYKEKR